MKITNTSLKNIKGDALKSSSNPPGAPPAENDPELLISDVLLGAALTPASNQPYEPAKASERAKFALSLYGTEDGDAIEVPSSLAAELVRDVSRIYNNVLITHQINELLK
jgi:hypothetical protein